MRFQRCLVVCALVLACAPLGCGSATPKASGSSGTDAGSQGGAPDGASPQDATVTPPHDGSVPVLPPTLGDAAPQGALKIDPPSATLNVVLGVGQSVPTKQFSATLGGQSVAVAWSVPQGQIGHVSAAGVFTPAAGAQAISVGGTATVTATALGQTATAQVVVSITEVQSGDPSPSDAGVDSAGGYGGVGGDGVGDAATPGQITGLSGTPVADAGVTLLYPYDKTVFPRGILPPLLQWNYGAHSGANALTAVRLHMKETNYEYTGYFQAQPGVTNFQNQPIPLSAWQNLTYSNAGEPVVIDLTFLDAKGVVWGPVSESWIIAQGTLKGTIYYNSYGTNLVKNYTSGPYTFGGATLGIRPGAAGPTLIAGTPTECRVCHTVSANGAALFTQQGEGYGTTSAYLLSPDASVETVPTVTNGGGVLGWPALYPDGTLLMSNSGGMPGASTAITGLYAGLGNGSLATGTPLPATGLNGLGALTPTFSPDGKHVAFNYFGGPLGDASVGDQRSLAVLDFAAQDGGAPDAAKYAFSNGHVIWTPDGGVGAYFPSYLPTNDGVVVELQTASNGRDLAGTRANSDSNATTSLDGAHGELWWVDVGTGVATRLDRANGFDTDAGIAYLPPHGSFGPNPAGDVALNYEPTVNPVPSGGYAWVIFTSRRLYGNVATVNPFFSDVRYEPVIQTTPTPKKLWVAAVDLTPTPGKDPSHPAFYLPGQELMAGNSRGYWVVSPCEANGSSCASGDECCGGYCAVSGDAGLMCTSAPPLCATEGDTCSLTTPCCSGGQPLQCINNRCAVPAPPQPK